MGVLTKQLCARVCETPEAQAVWARLEKGGLCTVQGLSGAAQPMVVAALRTQIPIRPIVVITAGVKEQENFHQDLETWQRLNQTENGSLFYPAWEILPHESKLPHADVISERLETLVALAGSAKKTAPIVVTTSAALMQRTFPPKTITKCTRVIALGDRIDPLDLIEWLEENGYDPEAQVTQKGEIASRGGILDIYPLTSPWPVRVEFFGDEIESLRFFDPNTQISREPIERVTITLGGELGLLKKWTEKPSSERLGSLLDYLADDTIFLVCDSSQTDLRAAEYELQIAPAPAFYIGWREFSAMAEARGMTWVNFEESGLNDLAEPNHDYLTWTFQSLETWRTVGERLPEAQVADAQRREFFQRLHRWLRQDYEVQVFCNSDGERQRFSEVWAEYGLGTIPSASEPSPKLIVGALSRGFLQEQSKWVVVTDAEVFGRYKVQRPRRLKSPHAAASRSALDIDFSDLVEGDFVVHLQHGIGRFAGLKNLTPDLKKGSLRTEIVHQESLVIEFAPSEVGQPGPRLYVPVTEAHLVSKYVGAGKVRPTLNTLGGKAWGKTKAQAEESVRDLASELLAIQAARESQEGFSFGPDTPWQREFEGAFIYEETIDQHRAIDAAKRDMEMLKPMDRLICGDVGYGKTEVAIRAAFKAVMGGRQVAVLVPTTVLAQQHFNTFRERMADYPVRVEQMSRFRRKAEQRKILADLSQGSVDIVIGTHRLIQTDVCFKDLGLVVIDEEQRFGVMHKERFKLLRRMVDVLTLSATPIPRTLYLALTGARDMSTIETPPLDRLPVETIVTQYDERVVRDAIQRELNRGGQVFFLHNRVHDILAVATKLKALVPKARFLVGHGQMESDELEDVMAKFINGEADVLVSTTIIESGIDIPNANTIIIDRADRFGLSDLYQLRGRVGRYKHQAYAYLMLPRHAALLSDVRKRISAIKQYSSLGSGFKIAMRDLEIRGAGNLLGPQQSGHITAVGFDLYCQLLKQSVASLKGEKVKMRVMVQVSLDFLALNAGEETSGSHQPRNTATRRNEPEVFVPREVPTYYETKEVSSPAPTPSVVRYPAYVPVAFISEPQQRIEIHRKLAQATEKTELETLRQEMRDRFGPLPPSVELLFQVSEIKQLSAERNITVVETKGEKLILTRNGEPMLVGGKFPRMTKKKPKDRLNEIRKLLLAI